MWGPVEASFAGTAQSLPYPSCHRFQSLQAAALLTGSQIHGASCQSLARTFAFLCPQGSWPHPSTVLSGLQVALHIVLWLSEAISDKHLTHWAPSLGEESSARWMLVVAARWGTHAELCTFPSTVHSPDLGGRQLRNPRGSPASYSMLPSACVPCCCSKSLPPPAVTGSSLLLHNFLLPDPK